MDPYKKQLKYSGPYQIYPYLIISIRMMHRKEAFSLGNGDER